MKIEELIEILKGMPPKHDVLVSACGVACKINKTEEMKYFVLISAN